MASFEIVSGHAILTPLPQKPIVVDVGANRGRFARLMHERVDAHCILVEANPALVPELSRDFTVLPYAVHTRDGEVALQVAQNDEGSSILQLPSESIFNCTLDHVESVPCRTLERILIESNVDRVDVLKFDIEGAEMSVLGTANLHALPIGQITVEFHCDPLFGFGGVEVVEHVIRRLSGLGFLPLDFTHPGEPKRSNMLFINRGWHDVGLLRAMTWRAERVQRRVMRRLHGTVVRKLANTPLVR